MPWGWIILYTAAAVFALGALLPAVLRIRAWLLKYQRDRRIQKAADDFSAYIDRKVVERVMEEPADTPTLSYAPKTVTKDETLQIPATERIVTVGHTNLRGWVSLTERLGDRRAVEVLNAHLDAVIPIIRAQGGTIVNFQGDSVFFAFNTMTPDPNHALHAARAAADILRSTEQAAEEHGGLVVHIGLATGPCLVGDFGGGGFSNYSARGHPVDLSERLASLADHRDTSRVLMNAETARLVLEHFPLERLPPETSADLDRGHAVFELRRSVQAPSA